MKRFYTNHDLIHDSYGRWFYLPKRLADLGCHVEVFCPDFKKRESFSIKKGGVVFHAIPTRIGGLWGDMSLCHEYSPDIWIASGNLPAGMFVRKLARQQGVPWVFDCYDYYPAFAPRAIRVFSRHLFEWLLRKSSGVTVVSRKLEDWAAERTDFLARIPNGVDTALFRPALRRDIQAKLGIESDGRFLIGIFGSIRDELGLSEVLDVVRRLRSNGRAVDLVAAGQCESLERLEAVDARWLGMLPQEELVDWIRACDCVLVPYRKSLQVAYSNSCRLLEFIALKAPLVASRTGDASFFLPTAFNGWCEPNNAESLLAAVERQIEAPELPDFDESLAWDCLGTSLLRFLQDVLQR